MRLVITRSTIRLLGAALILKSFSKTISNYSLDPTETQVAVLWVSILTQIIRLPGSISTLSSHGRRTVLLTRFRTLCHEGTLSATRVLQTLTFEVAHFQTWAVQRAEFAAPIRATAAKRLAADPTKSQSLQILQGGIPKLYYHWTLFHPSRPCQAFHQHRTPMERILILQAHPVPTITWNHAIFAASSPNVLLITKSIC